MCTSYFAVKDEFPRSAWFISKMGRLTAGVQYEPECKLYSVKSVLYHSPIGMLYINVSINLWVEYDYIVDFIIIFHNSFKYAMFHICKL
jgi:hypothetical protein